MSMSQMCKGTSARSGVLSRRVHVVRCSAHRPSQSPAVRSQAEDATSITRRAVLTSSAALALFSLQAGQAHAQFGVDIARKVLRPDEIDPQQAVVVLMDARSTLREIQALAATSKDSQERFEGRKLWPSFAKRLREVGPAAPVVAALVSGAGDKEDTLSEMYGGKAGVQGITDSVYMGLGKVLTISGRTIRPEAQATPEAAREAELAINNFLEKVPKGVYDAAQEFRVQRAAKSSSA